MSVRLDAAGIGVIIRDGLSNNPMTTCRVFVEIVICLAPRKERQEIGIIDRGTSKYTGTNDICPA